MNVIDIIFAVIFLIALYKGYKNGIVVELCGILGIIIGIFVANIFSPKLAVHIDIAYELAVVVAFIAIFLAFVLSVYFIAKIISKLLKLTGLGTLNSILGSIASLIKVAIVMSLLYSTFQVLNDKNDWVDKKEMQQSYFDPILNSISKRLFPHVEFIKDYFIDATKKVTEDGWNSN
ncbi:MAG: CvpA family protein [Rikenellaceae bacterium]